MERLTTKEAELMNILWRLKKAFVKDIIKELPEPKPHYNTLSTVIRRLEDKGFVGHETFGSMHKYFSKVPKNQYRKEYMRDTIDTYFENSYKNVVSFFAKNDHISKEELKEILEKLEENK